MSELIVSLFMVGVAFRFAKGASGAVTGLGFLTQSIFTGIFLILAIPVAMGFVWPFLVIGVMGMILAMGLSLVCWKQEQTVASLLWLLVSLINGSAVALQLAV